jgi:hypothetical protein
VKSLISASILATALCAFAANVAAADNGSPASGTSASGKNLTVRVGVEICGEYHSGADQIFAGVGCKEPAERPYGGYYILKENRCTGFGGGGAIGREVELMRTFDGKTSRYLEAPISNTQGSLGEIFNPIYTGGEELRFPPGSYSLRAEEFSYREKVWKKSTNVYYHDAKIVCEKSEFNLGPLPPDYTGGGPSK